MLQFRVPHWISIGKMAVLTKYQRLGDVVAGTGFDPTLIKALASEVALWNAIERKTVLHDVIQFAAVDFIHRILAAGQQGRVNQLEEAVILAYLRDKFWPAVRKRYMAVHSDVVMPRLSAEQLRSVLRSIKQTGDVFFFFHRENVAPQEAKKLAGKVPKASKAAKADVSALEEKYKSALFSLLDISELHKHISSQIDALRTRFTGHAQDVPELDVMAKALEAAATTRMLSWDRCADN